MSTYKTEQEEFWAGEFGNDYVERNKSQELLSTKLALFSKILQSTEKIDSCLELGANIGLNLRAIGLLLPKIKMTAVEINKNAAEECRKNPQVTVYEQSILDFSSSEKWDMTFTAGVLIHLNPDELNKVYDILYNNSNRYILVSEYYNPSPVEVEYRGNSQKLFKRDFAGEIMNRFSDLKLIDYGFIYHRDNVFPGDDLTWFLMEKK